MPVFSNIVLQDQVALTNTSYRAAFRVSYGCNGSPTKANTPANALPDGHYDEWVLRGNLRNAGGPLGFKNMQTCETAANHWAEAPAQDRSTQGVLSGSLMRLAKLPCSNSSTSCGTFNALTLLKKQ